MKTHYENNSGFKKEAKNLLKKYDFVTALAKCVDINPVASIDLAREYLLSYSEKGFAEFLETDNAIEIISLLYKCISASGVENGVIGEVTLQLMTAWQTARYELYGKRTYIVSSGLSRKLLATEFKGIRCGDLRLPYKSVYVVVDPSLGFKVLHQSSGIHELYGIYITEDEYNDEGTCGWRLMLCGLPKKTIIDDALTQYFIDLTDKDRLVSDVISKLKYNTINRDDKFYLKMLGITSKDATIEEIMEEWVQSFYYVMNLMFYVTRPDFVDLEHIEANKEAEFLYRRIKRLPKNSNKRKKLNERLREEEKRPRILVGRRVVVDERLPKNVSQSVSKIYRRTLVPAHWQRYHIGKGRIDIAWRFKEPFWKGEGLEENKPHEIR